MEHLLRIDKVNRGGWFKNTIWECPSSHSPMFFRILRHWQGHLINVEIKAWYIREGEGAQPVKCRCDFEDLNG